MGIEPTFPAWKAGVLPIYDTRTSLLQELLYIMFFRNAIPFLKFFLFSIFNTDDVYFSHGRVNLIGEHTDYNGGNVFPCALSIGTYSIVSKGTDSKVIFNSLNFKELGTISFDLNNMIYDKKDYWANYPKGVTKSYKEKIGYPPDFWIQNLGVYIFSYSICTWLFFLAHCIFYSFVFIAFLSYWL